MVKNHAMLGNSLNLGFWKNLRSAKKPFLALAPMEDATDYAFREILAKIAPPDVFFTEFTNTEGLMSVGREAVIKRLLFSKQQRPIVAQLWGTNPENMRKSTRIVAELGFDGIDINMGCPDKSVVKVGAGAALIENWDLAKKLIEAAKKGAEDAAEVNANSIPVSIKTRIGFNKIVTEEWCEFLLQQNIACLTVHGRTKKQMSKVPANWGEIEKVVKIRDKLGAETVIVGNGDVKNRAEAEEKATNLGVDGVMIGRGVFENLWIFEKIPRTHTKKECLELLLEHTKLFEEIGGKTFAVMKKFFKIYVKGFDGAVDLREKLMGCENYNEVEALIAPLISTSLIS